MRESAQIQVFNWCYTQSTLKLYEHSGFYRVFGVPFPPLPMKVVENSIHMLAMTILATAKN